MHEFPEQSPTPPPRVDVPWGSGSVALGMGVLVLFTLAAAGVLILLLRLTDTPPGERPAQIVLASTLVLQLGMLTAALLPGPLRARRPPGYLLGVRSLSPARLLRWSAAAFVGSLAISAAYVIVVSVLQPDLVPAPLPAGVNFYQLPVFSFVSIVLIAPFAEEIFFRGFLFAGLAKRFGFWIAAFASAVVFAAVHMELGRLMPALLSGIVFAWVYWRSGSVWPAVVAHTSQNAIAFGLAS